MSQIVFLLLCHKEPEEVVAQVRALVAAGDGVVIHHDARAPAADHARLRAALGSLPRVVFAARRRACGWGDWSLVAATLSMIRAALAAFPAAGHLYLLSGDCRPVKSAAHVRAALAADPRDRIEAVDFFTSGWIRTGLRDERLVYRHPFNERAQPRLFAATLALQRRLGLRRALPRGIRPMIGSQWWCLRRDTAAAVLRFAETRPDVVRFYRLSWIPDETFVQTVVRHIRPETGISGHSPTFHLFSDYGLPVTFHADHLPMLLAEDRFFARKISADAPGLRGQLDALWASGRRDFAASTTAARRQAWLAGRGRVGLRMARRAWDRGGEIGADRCLHVILCKDWHMGRRLAERIGAVTGLPAFGYIFDEEAAVLPDLGGAGRRLAARNRNRRAFLSLLAEATGAERIVFCLDPHARGVIGDLRQDRAGLRLLEVAIRADDRFLAGHAARLGLVDADTPDDDRAAVLTALRIEAAAEADALRDLGLADHQRLHPDLPVAEMAIPLAAFLGIPTATAAAIPAAGDIFAD